MDDSMQRGAGSDADTVNPCTCIAGLLWSTERPSIREIFIARFGAIRRLCEGQPHGLTVIAIGPGGLVSTRLEAGDSAPRALIVGRHECCGLRLRGDASVSLRHLAVLLQRRTETSDLRFRVIDLATPTALLGENGEALESLESEGPVFLHCGAHTVLFFPTGDEIAWPDDPAAGWQCIPERVYFDEHAADLDARRALAQQEPPTPRPEPAPADDAPSRHAGVSIVTSLRGPRFVDRRLGDDDILMGHLKVRTRHGRERIPIGRAGAHLGLLLGRYSRCEPHSRGIIRDHQVSRVHVLLVRIDGELWAVDTASTNGMQLDVEGEPDVAIHRLDGEQSLYVAGFVARLDWVPAARGLAALPGDSPGGQAPAN